MIVKNQILRIVTPLMGAFLILVLALVPGEAAGNGPDKPPANSFESANTSGLFTEVQALDGAELDESAVWVMRQRYVTVNFDQLTSSGPSSETSDPAKAAADTLLLNLFDDVLLQATLVRVEPNRDRGYTWIGRVDGRELSLVTLTVADGLLIGEITTPYELYQIRYVKGDLHAIREIDQAALPPEAPPVLVPDLKNEPPPPSPQTFEDDGSIINVLVAYTAAARSHAGGTATMEALIDNYIAYTNQSYINSGINQRLNLVHTYEVDYVQGNFLSTDLSKLTADDDGYMDEVHTKRDTYLADLVTLFVDVAKEGCGIAWLMQNVNPDFASHAFNVTAERCSASTFAHELGHNMGAHHERYVTKEQGAYPYSYGYVYGADTSNGWRTIMSYGTECADKGGRCPRIPYWSNPDVTYGGIPMGVPAGDPLSADNRQTLNNTAATVANFRSTAASGHIVGKVTSETDGSPLAGIRVNVYISQEGGIPTPRTVITGADGLYDVGALPTGYYRVEFDDRWSNYLREFYNNKPDYFSADNVYVITGTTTTIDVALAESGHIAGKVTAKADGSPLGNITVEVYDLVEWGWGSSRSADTADDGTYDIKGLNSGIYRLQFRDESGTYVKEYYNNAWEVESAADVPVTAGSTTTVNIELSLAGYIAGKVTPVPNDDEGDYDIWVTAFYEENGEWKNAGEYADAFAFGDGSYELRGLRAGTYRVRFSGEYDGCISLAPEYFDNVTDVTKATDVRVRAGKVTGDINADLDFPVPPPNDDFDQAIVISAMPFSDQQNMMAASYSLDDPLPPCYVGYPGGRIDWHNIWYRYTARQDELLSLKLYGAGYADKLVIWEGAPGSLTNIICDLQAGPVEGLSLKMGKTYYIEIANDDYYSADYVTLKANTTPLVTQQIPLRRSWNIISSYVNPLDCNLEAIFAPIASQMVLLKNDQGQVYWPDKGINTIGCWNPAHGYQVYMNAATTLTIKGALIDPQDMPIALEAGWSTVPYLRTSPSAVDQALASVKDELYLVKSNNGLIYWPDYGINQIGEILPGSGYRVYMNKAGTLIYPAND